MKTQKLRTRINKIRVWDGERLEKLSDEEFIDTFVRATEDRTDLKDGDLVIERKLKNGAPANSIELCLNEAQRRGISLDLIASKVASRAMSGKSHLGTLIVSKKWKRFEILAAKAIGKWLEADGIKVDKVDFDARVQGIITKTARQVDVLLERHIPRQRIAVECKDHSSAISVNMVEAFQSKLIDIRADKGVLIANGEFQRSAKTTASHYGIVCLTFRLTNNFVPPADLDKKTRSELLSENNDIWCLRYNDSEWYFTAKKNKFVTEEDLAILRNDGNVR